MESLIQHSFEMLSNKGTLSGKALATGLIKAQTAEEGAVATTSTIALATTSIVAAKVRHFRTLA